MPILSATLTFFLSACLVVGSIWIGNNVNFLPIDASTNAPIYDELFRVLFIIGTILFTGITGLVVFSLIKFRRKDAESGDGIPLKDNLPLEILWTAIPAIVILFVGLYSYDIYDRMGGMTPLANEDHAQHMMSHDATQLWGGIGSTSVNSTEGNTLLPIPIEVNAMQFAFIFHYPKGDIISGELHVPAGKPISMKMESKDVIHAFWVPEFRLKQDVIPGQPTILNFTATKPGRYPVICAELCGPYHGGMRSTVVVESPSEYEEWYKNNAKEISS